jgi:transcriptional regulator with XRE-family HTH domain
LSREGGLKLSFSDLLRQFRRRAGLTQAELAEKAGLSYRTISDLERGVRTKVYASTVGLISSALSLPEDDAASLAASVDRSRKSRLNGRDISPLSPK